MMKHALIVVALAGSLAARGVAAQQPDTAHKPVTPATVATATGKETKRVAKRTAKTTKKAAHDTGKQAQRTGKSLKRAVSREERQKAKGDTAKVRP